jgi:hypothetical protein
MQPGLALSSSGRAPAPTTRALSPLTSFGSLGTAKVVDGLSVRRLDAITDRLLNLVSRSTRVPRSVEKGKPGELSFHRTKAPADGKSIEHAEHFAS